MGRPRSEPNNPVGKLIHKWMGSERTYKWVRDRIQELEGIDLSLETVRFACRGEAGPKANYHHRGIRDVGDREGTIYLVARVLGIPDDLLEETLNLDSAERRRLKQEQRRAKAAERRMRLTESDAIGYYQHTPFDLPFRNTKVA